MIQKRKSPEIIAKWVRPTSLTWRQSGLVFLAVNALGFTFLGISALIAVLFGGGTSISMEVVMMAVPVILYGIYLDWRSRRRLLLAAQCGIALPLYFVRAWLTVSPGAEFVSHLALLILPTLIWWGGDSAGDPR